MKTYKGLIHWLPRIICILAILFVSIFAFDSFSPGLTIWQQLGAFFMHLIPSIVLTALLLVAWKWEYIGGIIFTIIGIGLSPLLFLKNYHMNHSIWISIGIVLMITFPFIIAGTLFIMSYNMKKKPIA
jgi:hypothetical protein